MLGLGIWVRNVWVVYRDFGYGLFNGSEGFSGSRYVLTCFNEHVWTFLNCVFGLGLGLGLRKRVHLGLDLGGLVLAQLDVEDLGLAGLWAGMFWLVLMSRVGLSSIVCLDWDWD